MNRRYFSGKLAAALILAAGAFWLPALHANDDAEPTIAASKVTEVTLYRSQALVTRTVEVTGEAGATEIVVSDLPENIDPSTMFAEGDEGVEVRAVRYRARAVGDSPREDVRELEEKIRSIQQEMQTASKQIALIQKQSKYLDKLESFTPPTADFDLGRGVLDAESVEQLTKFSFNTRKELLQSEVELNKQQGALQKSLSLTQRKLREITNGSTNQLREAVLFVQKTKPGKGSIRLNYLTNACRWSPTYTVRANTGEEKVSVEYNGLIQQMSGEDWKDVKLTLSTASPALSAAGPGLAPFRLTLVANQPAFQANAPMQNYTVQAPQQQGQVMMMGKPNDLKELVRAQRQAINMNRIATGNEDNLKTSFRINNLVNQFDCLAITSDSQVNSTKFSSGSSGGDEPALTYVINSPVSLRSRNSQQMVRVLTTDLKSSLYHVATPVLTSYVYREAELLNDSKSDLLEGPLTVYLDGRFVGRSEIPTVARGQNFVVGLGADSQLRSSRKLVDRSKRINGGNRETTLEYKLIVENYKEEPAKIRVVDRMPNVGDESKIRVTLDGSVEDKLSTDGVYVRTMLPQGILRWDTEVAGRSVGENAHEIDYSFKLEYDRQYAVALPSSGSRTGDDPLDQAEYEQYKNMENSRRGGKRK